MRLRVRDWMSWLFWCLLNLDLCIARCHLRPAALTAVSVATCAPLRIFVRMSANEWCLTPVIAHGSVGVAWPEAPKQTCAWAHALLTTLVNHFNPDQKFGGMSRSQQSPVCPFSSGLVVIGSEESFAGLMKPSSETQTGNVIRNDEILSQSFAFKGQNRLREANLGHLASVLQHDTPGPK